MNYLVLLLILGCFASASAQSQSVCEDNKDFLVCVSPGLDSTYDPPKETLPIIEQETFHEVKYVQAQLIVFIDDMPNAGYEQDEIGQVALDLAALSDKPNDCLTILQLVDDWNALVDWDNALEKLHTI